MQIMAQSAGQTRLWREHMSALGWRRMTALSAERPKCWMWTDCRSAEHPALFSFHASIPSHASQHPWPVKASCCQRAARLYAAIAGTPLQPCSDSCHVSRIMHVTAAEALKRMALCLPVTCHLVMHVSFLPASLCIILQPCITLPVSLITQMTDEPCISPHEHQPFTISMVQPCGVCMAHSDSTQPSAQQCIC